MQHKSTGDEEDIIEDVTLKTLSTLISSVDHLAVLFCKLECERDSIKTNPYRSNTKTRNTYFGS